MRSKIKFAIIWYSHQKSFKKIWVLFIFHFDLHSKKVHETEKVVQGASGQAKFFLIVSIWKDIKYRFLVYGLQFQKGLLVQKWGKFTKGRRKHKEGEHMIQNLHICWHTLILFWLNWLIVLMTISIWRIT